MHGRTGQATPRCLLPLLALVVLACERGPASPAIGFTYSWGTSPLERVIQQEVDAARPRGGDSVRVVSAAQGDWQSLGETMLAAEVARAAVLAENPTVLAVVGPGGSREALQVAPIYAAEGLPSLVPTATSRLLLDAGPTSFIIAPNDSVQGVFIAAYADSTLRARHAAIVYVADEYGVGLSAGTEAEFTRRGVTLVSRIPLEATQRCADDDGRRYFATLAASLVRRQPPEVVVFALRTPEALCAARAIRAVLPTVALVAGDGVYVDEMVFRSWAAVADGMYLVAFWHPSLPDSASRAFTRRYRDAVGLTPRHGDAVFRDAAVLAATAIHEGGRSRRAVQAYLRSLGVTRPPFRGISGPIAFPAGFTRPLLMTQIRGADSHVVLAR